MIDRSERTYTIDTIVIYECNIPHFRFERNSLCSARHDHESPFLQSDAFIDFAGCMHFNKIETAYRKEEERSF